MEIQVLKKYFNVYENLSISALAPQCHLPLAGPPLQKWGRPGRPSPLSHMRTREGAGSTSCTTALREHRALEQGQGSSLGFGQGSGELGPQELVWRMLPGGGQTV